MTTTIQPLTITALSHRAHANSLAHGFWDGHDPADVTVLLAKLALLVSEVGEAVEAVRVLNMENLGEELADIVIRACDLAEAVGCDLEQVVLAKMAKNEARPYKHGKLA